MLVIRVFSVLDDVVVHVDVLDRSTLGQDSPPAPTFLAHAQAPLDLVSEPRALAGMIYGCISKPGSDGHQFSQQLTC